MLKKLFGSLGTQFSCVRTLNSNSLLLPKTAEITPVPLAYSLFGEPSDCQHAPLVLVHGMFGQKANFNHVVKSIQSKLNNQVFLVDLRNHGKSPRSSSMTYPHLVADVANFLETVVFPTTGFKKSHVLGHSMGGKAVAFLALEPSYQHLLKSIIVEDISFVSKVNIPEFRQYIEGMRKVNLKQTRQKIGKDLEPSIEDFFFRNYFLTDLVLVTNREYRWQMNLDALSTHLEHIMGYTATEGNYSGSALVLHGVKSDYLLKEDFPMIQRFMPNACFVDDLESSHFLHVENPVSFVNDVVNFVKKVDHRN